MDTLWTSEPWVVVMSIAMGIGAFVISLVLYRVMSSKRLPTDLRQARDGLELATRHVINCNLQLMEAIRELSDSCRDMPPEYVVVANQALRLAQLMEEAAFEEGAREGVFPRPMFTAGHQFPPPGQSVQVPDGSNVVRLPAPPNLPDGIPPTQQDWINGQLIRTG